MADVQTTEADVITSIVHVRLMLLPVIIVCGRCYTTYLLQHLELADVIAKWQMEPEEAMFDNWQKLVSSNKNWSCS